MRKTFVEKMKERNGYVMVLVLMFILLATATTVTFTTMIRQDMELIGRAKTSEQARALAEAGVRHALVKLKNDGFDSRANFSGSLDTGSYAVTYTEVGERTLLTSVGTVGDVSRRVSAEIESNFPTALNKMFAGANDVKARGASKSATVNITGDIHANNDVELRAMNKGEVNITGRVSATGIVQEGSRHYNADNLDDNVSINGQVSDSADIFEGEPRVIFPTFEFDKYKQEAIAAGDYYSGNQTFNNQNLSPTSGVIYVDGDVNFKGTCVLYGGVVADDVDVTGDLTQYNSGDRNFIIAKTGDVLVNERLEVEEAIVSASRDVRTRAAGTELDVTGVMLAGRDMSFWNVQTVVYYTHKLTHPSDLPGTSEDDRVRILSWNQ